MSDHDPNLVPKKHFALIGQKAIIYYKDKFLILQRSEKVGGAGLWSIPGGGLDTEEDPLESINREIQEETRIEVSEVSPFALRSYTSKGDFIVIIGYKGITKSNKVKLNWEHINYKWVNKDNALKEKLSDDAKFFIEQLKQ